MKSTYRTIACLMLVFATMTLSAKDAAAGRMPIGHWKVSIPKREHGYSNFETVVIGSKKEYAAFIEAVNRQKAWNAKAKVIDALNAAAKKINFKNSALVLLRHTEGSGSVAVSLAPLQRKGKNLIVRVNRKEPEMGTADMAYYCFAIAVYKTAFDKVEYHSKGKKTVLSLKAVK